MNSPQDGIDDGNEKSNDPRMFGVALDDPDFDSRNVIGLKYPYPKMAPRDFELIVKQTLDAEGAAFTDYQSKHREVLDGFDGSYEIDIAIRFGFFGLEYVTLVECKAYGSPVKREKVAELWAKLQSLGAHKGVLFSTSGFQSGALKFALRHGIALVHVADKMTSVLAKANTEWMQNTIAAQQIDDVCCWLFEGTLASLLSDNSNPTIFVPKNANTSVPGLT